jgi:hypothetical protein
MVAAVARVNVVLPTWSAPPVLARPTLPALPVPVTAVWRRVRRHVVVATVSLLTGVMLWLPGGFELGLAARLAIGVFTGGGMAVIATAISLSLPPR